MAFHEQRFPTEISYGSLGGPSRRTEIIVLDSGFEQRNSAWSQSRHRYNISYGIKTYDQLHTVKAFWEARNGPLHGFRFKDWADYKSVAPQQSVGHSDQVLSPTADGARTTWQLIKAYTSGSNTYTRNITKPVSGTVRVSKNGTESFSGWTVDTATGIITFTTAPTAGQVIRAGFEFDTPVRFEADRIEINLAGFERGELQDIVLTELRI